MMPSSQKRFDNDTRPLLNSDFFSSDSNARRVPSSISPTATNITTPRRIVRTHNFFSRPTQLVQLDRAPSCPLSAGTSVTAYSEEVDDLVSETLDVDGESYKLLMGPFVNDACVSNEQPTNMRRESRSLVDSASSRLQLSGTLSSCSLEYAETAEMESMNTCSTGVGDHRSCTLSTTRHIAATSRSLPEGGGSTAKIGDLSPPRPSQSVISTNIADCTPQRRIVNVRREERIGRGTFGDVFRAVDLDTGLPLAIKQILVTADMSKDPEKQLQSLEREIKVMRKLNHKHIVKYYSARRDENCSALLIYMEYVGGGTVAQRLKAHGAFSEDEARNYTRQLLQGLEYLHRQSIVHRDLKGDNLFLTEDGVLKVGDFGTSKDLQTTRVTNSVAGTPNFMAPEVISCTGHSYMADIWSVGCCVLEMLTGHPPFWNLDNYMAVMFAITKGELEKEVPANLSDDARDFIRKCAQTDPKERLSAVQLQQHPWLKSRSITDGVSASVTRCFSFSSLRSTEADGAGRGGDVTEGFSPNIEVSDVFIGTAAVAVAPGCGQTSRSRYAVMTQHPNEGGTPMCLPSLSRERHLPGSKGRCQESVSIGPSSVHLTPRSSKDMDRRVGGTTQSSASGTSISTAHSVVSSSTLRRRGSRGKAHPLTRPGSHPSRASTQSLGCAGEAGEGFESQ
ncbi:Protein tyrosine kinase Protein kinase domain [Trypanosoma vivax]|uniref:Protein kinase domain-containing protein n=1 Tax=Trypanosoma vivax (strain Y486) TaxID=1055687 RepID=G0TWM3_TRYVY|nr:putative protein kinase [Trypanosoma vivax]KAH8608960.1 Protein tyrosine kinase Protein kinase domain [Trypanosoma vivax]CCC48361.1 putative protein kinase [Trypanosoma vivax Y486]